MFLFALHNVEFFTVGVSTPNYLNNKLSPIPNFDIVSNHALNLVEQHRGYL